MSDYAFLMGEESAAPAFEPDDTTEQIAYALAAVPVAWLALFEAGNIVTDRQLESVAVPGGGGPLTV